MLTLRHCRRTRALLSPSISPSSPPAAALVFFSTAAEFSQSSLTSFLSTINLTGSQPPIRNNVIDFYQDWFLSRKKPLFHQIYEILRTQEGSSIDSHLSKFNLYLTEELVLQVLKYDNRDVHACVKFFDWAGKQRGYHHTKLTFTAIFRIMSKAQKTTWMLEILKHYGKSPDNVSYYSTLVVGYAISGKPDIALEVFGKMRFGGKDLDGYSYHVLLDSLVEQGYFDAAEMLAKEIRVRGQESALTHSLVIKSLTKQNELEKGEMYLRGILSGDGVAKDKCGPAVAALVSALCKDNEYWKAAKLVEESREMGVVSMEHTYSV